MGSAVGLRPLQTGMVQFYALAMVLGRAGADADVVDVAGDGSRLQIARKTVSPWIDADIAAGDHLAARWSGVAAGAGSWPVRARAAVRQARWSRQLLTLGLVGRLVWQLPTARPFAASAFSWLGPIVRRRRAIQPGARRPEHLAVRAVGAADVHLRAGELGGDQRSARAVL